MLSFQHALIQVFKGNVIRNILLIYSFFILNSPSLERKWSPALYISFFQLSSAKAIILSPIIMSPANDSTIIILKRFMPDVNLCTNFWDQRDLDSGLHISCFPRYCILYLMKFFVGKKKELTLPRIWRSYSLKPIKARLKMRGINSAEALVKPIGGMLYTRHHSISATGQF